MSEFSTSFHLRGDDPSPAVAMLRRAAVPGYVFRPERQWVPFVYLEPKIGLSDARDRIVFANEGCLLHCSHGADHGLRLEVYEGRTRVARLDVSYESPKKATFDRAAFLDRSLMTPKAADGIEAWLAGKSRRSADGAKVVASALGLTRFRWFAYRYECESEEPAEGRIEVDVAGNVRASGPREVDERAVDELLRSLPATKKKSAAKAPAVPDHSDALAALADISRSLQSRASKAASVRPRAKSKTKR